LAVGSRDEYWYRRPSQLPTPYDQPDLPKSYSPGRTSADVLWAATTPQGRSRPRRAAARSRCHLPSQLPTAISHPNSQLPTANSLTAWHSADGIRDERCGCRSTSPVIVVRLPTPTCRPDCHLPFADCRRQSRLPGSPVRFFPSRSNHYIYSKIRRNLTGVRALGKGEKGHLSWVIIGPDMAQGSLHGAFDLASFLKRRMAFAVEMRCT